MYYMRPLRPDELYHHGVKGQKWGLRRFQNADGSLTADGRKRYKVDSLASKTGRMLFNTELGQRLAVRRNKGFRQDKKVIKKEFKEAKQKILDKNSKKEQTKELKKETKAAIKDLKQQKKANLNEAKIATADAIYGRQSHAANAKIQTESTGKALAKSLLMGGYGAKRYNEIRYDDSGNTGRVKAYVLGSLTNFGNPYSNYLAYAKTAKAPKQKKVKEKKEKKEKK